MSNLRKILSLFLAIFIIVTSMSTVYADDGTDTTVGIEAQLLEHLGALTFTADEADNTQSVTRAEFCYMVAKLIKAESNAVLESPFSDVTESTDYASSILNLYDMGIVSGTGENFEPYSPITVTAALKIVSSVLGYGEMGMYLGGYPAGYLAVGKRLNLIDNIEDFGDLSRIDCARLLYNALEIEFADIFINQEGIKHTIRDNTSILYSYHGLTKLFGRMTANTITTLSGIKGDGDNTVTINGETYKVESDAFNGLIGYEVEYYVHKESKTLCFASSIGAERVLEIPLENVLKKDSTNNRIHYFNDKDTQKEIRIDDDADYIVNGTAYPDFKFGDIAKSKGRLILIDYNSDNLYDVINYRHYDNFVVRDYSEQSGILRGINYRSIDFSNEADVYSISIVNNFGEEFSLKDLNENDVLSIYKDMYGKYYEIYLSNDIDAGSIEEVTTVGDITEVKVSGNVYKLLDDEDIDVSVLSAGVDCILYLDYMGDVAYVDIEKLTDMMYGFLIDCSSTGNQLSPEHKLKLMTQNGNIMIYDIAKKVMLNGTYTASDGSRYTPQKIIDAAVFYKDGVYKPQLIRYKLNKNKEIVCIETEGAQSKENTLKLNATLSGMDSRWMTNQNGFYFRYVLQDDAVIFKVPPIVNGTVDIAKMDVLKPANLVGSRRYEGVKLYDCDELNAAKCIVIPTDYVNVSGHNVFVVDKISKALNSDSEETYKLYGYLQSTAVSYLVSVDIGGVADDIKELSVGDVIGPVLNSKNELIGYDLFLKSNEASSYTNSQTNRASTPYQTCGIVTARNGNLVRVSLNGLETDDVYRIKDNANVYYVNLADETVKKSTVSDIEPQDIATTDTYVFFKFYNDQVNDVVIVKK